MRRSLTACIGLVLCFSSTLKAIEAEPLQRAFGLVIGDIIEQRVSLDVGGKKLELLELPIEQRVGPWVQRLSSKKLLDTSGKSWLHLVYQIVNSPEEPMELALPSLTLITNSTEPVIVSAQAFSLIPLTSARKADNNTMPFMIPDREPVIGNATQLQQKLRLALMALGTCLALWFVWWLCLRYRDRTVLPFSRAMHQLRVLRHATQASVDDNPQAWSIVHEAFNKTAGQTLSSRSANKTLGTCTWLQPFSKDIDSFYAASDKLFFDPTTTPTTFGLFEFCKSVYRAEKLNAASAEPQVVQQS